MTSGWQRRDGWRVAAAAAAALLAAACTSAEPGAYPEPPQPRATVREVPADLTVALPGPDGEFARTERARAATYLDTYRDGGRGPLAVTITAPDARTADRADAARTHPGRDREPGAAVRRGGAPPEARRLGCARQQPVENQARKGADREAPTQSVGLIPEPLAPVGFD